MLIRRAVVLAYHGVGDVDPGDDPHKLIVSWNHLEAHVHLLMRFGYNFATAEEVLERWAGAQPDSRVAVLTFDDGFADWLTIVAPLLQRLGVRATFYCCPGWWSGSHPLVAGERARLLDEAGARSLLDAGMELGSHTMSHPDLTKLHDGALRSELADSKAGIESLTGRPCRTLAYPHGLHDERVRGAARDCGYELAWAWLPGPWSPFAAPRLPGPPRHGAVRLALKLAGFRRTDPLNE